MNHYGHFWNHKVFFRDFCELTSRPFQKDQLGEISMLGLPLLVDHNFPVHFESDSSDTTQHVWDNFSDEECEQQKCLRQTLFLSEVSVEDVSKVDPCTKLNKNMNFTRNSANSTD